MPDTVPGDISTSVTLPIGTSVEVTIDTLGDRDWYRVDLVAGHNYTFSTALGSSYDDVDSYLYLYGPGGTPIAENDDGGPGTLSHINFTATTSGTYYIAAGTYSDDSTGVFALRATDTAPTGADTVAGSTGTTATLALGGTVNGSVDTPGDHDYYRVTLVAGQSYYFSTGNTGGGSDADTTITIRDSAGLERAYNDDQVLGQVTYSGLRFTASTSGTFYIDVAGWNDEDSGAYRLSMVEAPPLQVYDNDQIALQLTNGYWNGNAHHFNVGPGGSLTFNVQALTPAGQNLAREALLVWSDVLGITFNEVTSGGQITFDDNEDGAHASASYSGGVTTSARVNVSQAWLSNYGTGLNTYSFQTFIHEIGHALGLGHAGNYNSTADYDSDALYRNDAWVTTVMSYFDVNENSYFDGLNYSRLYVVTPMVADGVAVANLYGTNTLTRTGNTTYGFNNNSGRSIYDATAYPTVAYTVYDNGGVDTLDYSGFSQAQTINITQEQFSSVGGQVGNVSIARGTVIENAIGGGGNDLMIGNSIANTLTGGAGADTLIGLAGNDTLDGGLGNDSLNGGLGDDIYLVDAQGDVIYEAAGEGTDTANATASYYLWANVENLVLTTGSAAQYGVGNALANTITGNGGDNLLIGHEGNDTLFGGGGADRLYGMADNDTLWGGAGSDYLIGDGGTDVLHGEDGAGEQDFLYGGDGNDTYYVDAQNDLTFEDAGGGVDTVFAGIAGGTYYLFANVENLTLTGTTLYGVGNAIANLLTGSASANWLLGGGGDDRINGMGGNDVLFGEAGADTFVFTAGNGQDVIADFQAGTDRIDLSAFGLAWDAVVNSMHQNGSDTAIDLGGGNFFVVNGYTVSALVAAQSSFVLSASAAELYKDAAEPLFANDDLPAAVAEDLYHLA